MDEKNKTIIILILILLLVALSIFFVFRWQRPLDVKNISNSNGNNEDSLNNGQTNGPPVNLGVQDIKSASSFFIGTITNIDNNSLEVEFPGDIKYHYKINKEEAMTITKMEKNPNFNNEKFDNTLAQISAGNQNGNPQNAIEEMDKKAADDPELQMYLNKDFAWDGLKLGMKLNVLTEENGKIKLTVVEE